MPIDLSLLRPSEEGGNIKEVEKWQLLRLLGTTNFEHNDTTVTTSISTNNEVIIKHKIKSLLSEICHLEKERRVSLKECCQSRSDLKQLQLSLAPKKKKRNKGTSTDRKSSDDTACNDHNDRGSNNIDIDNIRQQIENLKKVIIPKLNAELDQKTKALDSLVPNLMNLVILEEENNSYNDDITTFDDIGRDFDDQNQDSTATGMSTTKQQENRCIDPLFCINGYEKTTSIPTWNMSSPSSTRNDGENEFSNNRNGHCQKQEKAYLCNNGTLLYDAICSYAKTFIQSTCESYEEKSESRVMNIPQSIPLEPIELSKSLLGSKPIIDGSAQQQNGKLTNQSKTTHEQGNHINVPSNIVLALLHQNKTFTDRELPKLYLCNTQTPITQQQQQYGNIGIGYKNLPLIQHTINQIEIFAISTCNVSISTRVQDDIVRTCIRLYKSLITNATELTKKYIQHCSLKSRQCKSSTPILRVQITSPCDLDPNEARRVTIEGYLPSKKEYICLGYVSNYTDFISRGLKIKCGGGGGPVEFAHLIHGKVCDFNVLNWMLDHNIASVPPSVMTQNNIIMDLKKTSHLEGIIIPKSIVQFIPPLHLDDRTFAGSRLFLPFQREIVRGKAGKITTKEIRGIPEQVWLHLDNDVEKHKVGSHKTTNTTQDDEKKQELKLTLPSAKDEASCNPYTFLPFNL